MKENRFGIVDIDEINKKNAKNNQNKENDISSYIKTYAVYIITFAVLFIITLIKGREEYMEEMTSTIRSWIICLFVFIAFIYSIINNKYIEGDYPYANRHRLLYFAGVVLLIQLLICMRFIFSSETGIGLQFGLPVFWMVIKAEIPLIIDIVLLQRILYRSEKLGSNIIIMIIEILAMFITYTVLLETIVLNEYMELLSSVMSLI